MIILGVDPGTHRTGYAVVQDGVLIDCGVIHPKGELPQRLFALHQGIAYLIQKHAPDVVAIEEPFVYKNPKSALFLGMAFGAIASTTQIPLFSYNPSTVKAAVTGTGRASKEQVMRMICMLLNLSQPPTPQDACDAIAIALCHLHRSKTCTTSSREPSLR